MKFSKSMVPVSCISALAVSSTSSFDLLIAGFGSEEQISANNAGEALRNAGTKLDRNLNRFNNSGEGSGRLDFDY